MQDILKSPVFKTYLRPVGLLKSTGQVIAEHTLDFLESSEISNVECLKTGLRKG